jgi:hypothetical protein
MQLAQKITVIVNCHKRSNSNHCQLVATLPQIATSSWQLCHAKSSVANNYCQTLPSQLAVPPTNKFG